MINETAIGRVIQFLIKEEGAIGQNPGEDYVTRWGQTPEWLADNHLPIPKSVDDATMNFHSWMEKTGLDELCTLNDGLPIAVIDYAVNSGQYNAIASLQRTCGVKADGVIGPMTLHALPALNRLGAALIIHGDRMRADGKLITDHPVPYAADAHGWCNRWADVLAEIAKGEL